MTIASLRELAQWHRTKADILTHKLQEEIDGGLSHQEREKSKTRIHFHADASADLAALANAFSSLSPLFTSQK